MAISRLDKLESELKQLQSLECLSYDLKEQCMKYYIHEIECIRLYHAKNEETAGSKLYRINNAINLNKGDISDSEILNLIQDILGNACIK